MDASQGLKQYNKEKKLDVWSTEEYYVYFQQILKMT